MAPKALFLLTFFSQTYFSCGAERKLKKIIIKMSGTRDYHKNALLKDQYEEKEMEKTTTPEA